MTVTETKLTSQVSELLYDSYMVPNPQDSTKSIEVRGQSISHLHQTLRDNGWSGLGNLNLFGIKLRSLGFLVVDGRSSQRGQRCQVVYQIVKGTA